MKVAFNENNQSFNQKLITVLLAAGALWSVWYLHEVILLVFLAVIIAIGISIPARKLQTCGWGKATSTGVSVTMVTLVFLAIILWLVPLLGRELQNFIVALPDLLIDLQRQYSGTGFGDILDSLITPTSDSLLPAGISSSENILSRFLDNGLPVVFSGAGVLVSVVTNLLLVLVVSVMLLIQPTIYIKALLYLVPPSSHQPIVTVANQIYETIKSWLKSLTFSVLFTTVTVFIGMSLLGVPNPAAIALFAALATFIPNIGAIIPIIPIALFTIGSSVQLFVIAVVVYLGIQLLESNIVTPLVVRSQLNIPVAGILISQIIAGVLFGLLGVLLAVPLLAMIIAIVQELVAKYHYGYDTSDIVLTTDADNHLLLE